MRLLETGTTKSGVPFARSGRSPTTVVLNGGQSFVRVATAERLERDAQRVARLLPDGAEFLLIGYDPHPSADLSIQQIVESTGEALAEGVGSQPIDLIGISYGGMVACRLAALRPEQVRHLVLVSSGHRFSARGAEHVSRQVELLGRGDLTGFATTFAALFRRPWYNWLVSASLRMSRRRVADGMAPTGAITRYLRAMLAAEPVDLKRVAAPTLVIGGSADQFFGDGVMEEAAAALPSGRLTILPCETHMAPIEAAKTFKAALITSAVLWSSTG